MEKRIAIGDRVLIDTSVFIAYFEPSDATHEVAALLVDAFVREGRNDAVVSPVTAMELLVHPLRHNPSSATRVQDFLGYWPHLELVPIDLTIAQKAAALRAAHRFATPDALIIATGIIANVAHILTNDFEWNKKLSTIKSAVQITELRNYV